MAEGHKVTFKLHINVEKPDIYEALDIKQDQPGWKKTSMKTSQVLYHPRINFITLGTQLPCQKK